MKKRFLSVLLSLSLVFGTVSAAVFADETAYESQNGKMNAAQVVEYAAAFRATAGGDAYEHKNVNESAHECLDCHAKLAAKVTDNNTGSQKYYSTLKAAFDSADSGDVCEHKNVNESAHECLDCHAKLAAKVTDNNTGSQKYYSTLQAAFDSAGSDFAGSILNLSQTDIKLEKGIKVKGFISYEAAYAGVNLSFAEGETLDVEDGGYLGCNGDVSSVTVKSGGRFALGSEYTVGELTVCGGSAPLTGGGKLQCGKFGKITVPDDNNIFQVIEKISTCKDENGNWLSDDYLKGRNYIENVIITQRPFYGEKITVANGTVQKYDGGNNIFDVSADYDVNINVTDDIKYEWLEKYQGKYYPVITEKTIANKDIMTKRPTAKIDISSVLTCEYVCRIKCGTYVREVSQILVVEKSEPAFTAPTANKLAYSGNAQALVAAGSTNDGKMLYSTEENGSYAEQIPSGTDANTYSVWYMVEGDDNHTDSEPKEIEVTIEPKDITGADVGEFAQMTYSGKAQIPSAEVTIDGMSVTGDWSSVTNVGDLSAFTANGNFKGKIENKPTGMAAMSIENAVVSAENSLTYNGNEQTQNVAVTLEGFENPDYTVSENTAKEAGEYTLTITGKGNFTGTKTMNFTVAKVIPTSEKAKEASATVALGGKLESAGISYPEFIGTDGKTVLKGNYTWKNGSKIISAQTAEKMTFTPEDDNYEAVEFDVTVKVASSGGGGGGGSRRTAIYTVTFETNGGSDVAKQSVEKGGTIAKPSEPLKEGYEFGGWFSDKALKNEYDFSEKVTGSFTLYAAWKENATEPEPEDKPDDRDKTDEPVWKNPFDDVNEGDWFYDDVKNSSEKGLFSGMDEKTFAPNGKITRAMFVTVIYRNEGEPKTEGAMPFADVAADAYFADAVVWAQKNGIVSGVFENEFAPDVNITREQIAAIMFRYAKYKGYDVSIGEDTNILSYSDSQSISEYAIPAMQYAVGSGLMLGKTESTLNPQDYATRAEIAAILNRFITENK